VIFDARDRLMAGPGMAGLMRASRTSEREQISRPIAEIIVRDWGMGVPPKDQHKLFVRFTRLERDLNSAERGSGLGLAICKELVEAMGGSIWVESSGVPGAGSVFHFTLPLSETAPLPTVNDAGWKDWEQAPGSITGMSIPSTRSNPGLRPPEQ
jgi:nitrogen fixation/metabolism regulation signal transduction histidine kinase